MEKLISAFIYCLVYLHHIPQTSLKNAEEVSNDALSGLWNVIFCICYLSDLGRTVFQLWLDKARFCYETWNWWLCYWRVYRQRDNMLSITAKIAINLRWFLQRRIWWSPIAGQSISVELPFYPIETTPFYLGSCHVAVCPPRFGKIPINSMKRCQKSGYLRYSICSEWMSCNLLSAPRYNILIFERQVSVLGRPIVLLTSAVD